MKRYSMWVFGLLVLLPSCQSGIRKTTSIKTSVSSQELPEDASGQEEQEFILSKLQHNQTAATCQVRQEEAKLFDVPIPLEVRPLERYEGSDAASSFNTFLAYASKDSLNDLYIFYSTQMERFGWKIEQLFDSSEKVLLFSKPNRTCCVIIRSSCKKRVADVELILIIADVY